MSKEETPKLELLPTQANQKEIDLNVKAAHLAFKGHSRAEDLTYAYAIIFGGCANRIMEIAEHGAGEKILAIQFPDVSKSQLHNWRNLAKDVTPHLAKSPIGGLLTAPTIGKKQLPAKKLIGLQDAVKKVLNGASMVDFHKSSRYYADAEQAGGPTIGGGHRKPTQTEIMEEANATVNGWADELNRRAMSGDTPDKFDVNILLASRPARKNLADACVNLGRALRDLATLTDKTK